MLRLPWPLASETRPGPSMTMLAKGQLKLTDYHFPAGIDAVRTSHT